MQISLYRYSLFLWYSSNCRQYLFVKKKISMSLYILFPYRFHKFPLNENALKGDMSLHFQILFNVPESYWLYYLKYSKHIYTKFVYFILFFFISSNNNLESKFPQRIHTTHKYIGKRTNQFSLYKSQSIASARCCVYCMCSGD